MLFTSIMSDMMSFIVEISLALFFAGIFLPIGFTAITGYAGNLTGTNASLWGYLITFAIVALVLYLIAPALQRARQLGGSGKGRAY